MSHCYIHQRLILPATGACLAFVNFYPWLALKSSMEQRRPNTFWALCLSVLMKTNVCFWWAVQWLGKLSLLRQQEVVSVLCHMSSFLFPVCHLTVQWSKMLPKIKAFKHTFKSSWTYERGLSFYVLRFCLFEHKAGAWLFLKNKKIGTERYY